MVDGLDPRPFLRRYSQTHQKKLGLLLGVWLIAFTQAFAGPEIDVSFPDSIPENFPIEGSLTITHQKQENIEEASFSLEGKPLKVSLTKEVEFSPSSETLLSLFSFELPGKKEGVYTLPPISVVVGKKTIHSLPTLLRVEASKRLFAKNEEKPILRLEAGVEGPQKLYPGEQTLFVYRIYYNQNIDLSASHLPLIHPDHFQKLGDVQIKEEQEGVLSKQTLTQRVEASEVGTFSFGPSFVAGYFYVMQNGSKRYDPTELKAEAPAIEIEVKPFNGSKAPSFQGAVGEIQIEATLRSSPQLAEGDLVELQVEIKGVSNLEGVQLPSLACSPGFSGFFAFDQAPALAEIKGKSKLFWINLRALTPLLEAIPSIEVSSFNPQTGKYTLAKSAPIPLSLASKEVAPVAFPFPLRPKEGEGTHEKEAWPPLVLPPLNF